MSQWYQKMVSEKQRRAYVVPVMLLQQQIHYAMKNAIDDTVKIINGII